LDFGFFTGTHFSGWSLVSSSSISDSKDHSTVVLDNISTASEKEEELTRDQPEKWVPVKKPKSNEKSQKGPKIIHERSVSWEDVDLSENQENDVPDKRSKMKKYFKIIGAVLLVLGTLIGAILSLMSFFGSANLKANLGFPIFGGQAVNSGKVKLQEVKLDIRANSILAGELTCGCENAYVEIMNGTTKEKLCQTNKIAEVNSNAIIKWNKEKKNLGDCEDIEFDANSEKINFEIRADDKFCPEELTFKMENNAEFIIGDMTNFWYNHTHVATRKNQE
jgi:hypothetical protein